MAHIFPSKSACDPLPSRRSAALAAEWVTLRACLIIAILLFSGAAKAHPDRCGAPLSAESASAGSDHLTVRFMGVSTLLFDDGHNQVMIDAFFSRPNLLSAAIGRIGPEEAEVAYAMREGGISPARLRAVFVTHTHSDHALDAPAIARLTDADMIGSTSLGHILAKTGLASGRVVVAQDHSTSCYGRFRVTAIATPHSSPNLFPHDIERDLATLTWAWRYRSGECFSYLIEHGRSRILVYPSAAYAPGRLKGFRADIVFLGIYGLGRKSADFGNAYWSEVVEATQATRVVPVHWDNFGRKLRRGLKPMPWPFDNSAKSRDRFEGLARSHGVTVLAANLFEPVELSGSAGDGDGAPPSP